MVILKERFRNIKQGLKKTRVIWERFNIGRHWKRYKMK